MVIAGGQHFHSVYTTCHLVKELCRLSLLSNTTVATFVAVWSDVACCPAMKNCDREVHPKGEMLSDNQRVFRLKVFKTFLKAGVPFHKVDDFRELLEATISHRRPTCDS